MNTVKIQNELSSNFSVSARTIEELVRQKSIEKRRQNECLVVSVVGAGGKTSLIYHLASQLKSDFKILVTTTTMMFKPENEVDQIFFQNSMDDVLLISQLEKTHLLAVEKPPVTGLFLSEAGAGTDIDGQAVIKVRGVSETLIQQIASTSLFDLILVEADGSRRRPLKAYAPHEPVLPPRTDLLVVVLGLKGLNMPLTAQSIHRIDQFLALTGKTEGERLQMEDLIHLFVGEESFLKSVPESCEVITLMNQADTVTLPNDLEQISKKLFAVSTKIKGLFVVSLDQNRTYAAYLNEAEIK